jgi:hypothetical protein
MYHHIIIFLSFSDITAEKVYVKSRIDYYFKTYQELRIFMDNFY